MAGGRGKGRGRVVMRAGNTNPHAKRVSIVVVRVISDWIRYSGVSHIRMRAPDDWRIGNPKTHLSGGCLPISREEGRSLNML